MTKRAAGDRTPSWLGKLIGQPGATSLQRPEGVADAVLALCQQAAVPDLVREIREARAEQRQNALPGAGTPKGRKARAQALARELAAVSLASTSALGLTPTRPQLIAAAALLDGIAVEMNTGEGKTLVGALAACVHALNGRRVHVLTVNDYLAHRDGAWMGPLFGAFGVTVASLGQDSTTEQRRSAYAAEVLYAPVSEVGYDVLRDGLAWSDAERVTPVFDVGIIDEADAVMIDEAVTPLVLAGESPYPPQDFSAEVEIVRSLTEGEHYECDDARSAAFLTDRGVSRVEAALGIENLYDSEDGAQLSRVNVALMAVAIAERDVDYLVQGGAVQLVSQSRGRVSKLQRWPDGLHAAVEAKEGLQPSLPGVILDTITVQELLSRYDLLAGMSGTLVAVAEELAEFYDLKVGRVQPAKSSVREDEAPAAFLTRAARDEAVADEVARCQAAGRPVLVGTQSVEDSETIAAMLAARGIEARVLNAKNDGEEAAVIAAAGDLGAVTISTQMSGRGTDIRLGGMDEGHRDEVLRLGGLRVLASGLYESQRLDAQLRGRAGRQGEPGATRFFLSMEDQVVVEHAPEFMRARIAHGGSALTARQLAEVAYASQKIAESTRLDQHRAAWSYSQAIAKQRAAVLRRREEMLDAEAAAERVARVAPELLADFEAQAGAATAAQACRDVALWQLDERWSDHLGVLSEIRDGVHLRALADEDPASAFHLIALKEFEGFFEGVDAGTVRELRALDPSELAAAVRAAVRRPSSTWTYMLVDNPLGSKGDRAIRGIRRLLHGEND